MDSTMLTNTFSGSSLNVSAGTERKLTDTELRSISTPWGAPQSGYEFIPGIQCFSTASHGGYWIASTRRAQMPAEIAATPTFAGPGWYEEDCDWALVVLAFPLLFDDLTLMHAISAVKHVDYHKPTSTWLMNDEAKPLHDRIASFLQKCGHLFKMDGFSYQDDSGWNANFRRVDGKQLARVVGVSYDDLCVSGPIDLNKVFGDKVQFDPLENG